MRGSDVAFAESPRILHPRMQLPCRLRTPCPIRALKSERDVVTRTRPPGASERRVACLPNDLPFSSERQSSVRAYHGREDPGVARGVVAEFARGGPGWRSAAATACWGAPQHSSNHFTEMDVDAAEHPAGLSRICPDLDRLEVLAVAHPKHLRWRGRFDLTDCRLVAWPSIPIGVEGARARSRRPSSGGPVPRRRLPVPTPSPPRERQPRC